MAATVDSKARTCECGCGEQTGRSVVTGDWNRFVNGHQGRMKPTKVLHEVDVETGCWNWIGTKTQKGYGRIVRGGKQHAAHRWYYQQLVGAIPEGLTLDHLCRNRACVNPEHLEPVTNVENVMRGEGVCVQNARKTHCKWGHPLDGANVIARRDGGRECRACVRVRSKA